MTRLKPLRWRRWNDNPKAYALFRGREGKWLAIVQQNRDGTWFWYGLGRNTANRKASLDAAKREAMEHAREIGA